MRRLLRIFFHSLILISLLLFVGALATWVRSYWTTQFVGWSNDRQAVGVLSMAGVLRFEHFNYPFELGPRYNRYDTPPGGLWNEVTARDRGGGLFKRMGFASARIVYYSSGPKSKEVRQAIYLPHWFAVLIFSFLPAIKLWTRLRPRAAAPGSCPACGYDLRATPQRCPECGAVPANLRKIEQHQL